ncbi:hypothetical protein ASE48_16220 [Mycobacterium sp. Root265]|nr:hypothetical protein ASE48_16220 [Mycobacterium sp. Root265]
MLTLDFSQLFDRESIRLLIDDTMVDAAQKYLVVIPVEIHTSNGCCATGSPSRSTDNVCLFSDERIRI